MLNTPYPKSTIATAVGIGLLGLALNSPVLAQTTTAIGSSTTNAISSGSGTANADGTTTVNAATVSGSGTAASGTAAPGTTTNPAAATAPNPTTARTTASGSTVVGADSSGSGNVNSTGSTTVNAATVNGSGTAASGTSAPATSSAAPATTAAAPSGSGTTTPGAASSSTSTANATAINDVDLFITGGTVSSTAPPGGVNVTGNNNVIGNNNNTVNGDNNAISAGSTNTAGSSTATAAGTETRPSSVLSGSNARSLQQGLRNGTTVTLTRAGETATFTPPSGHMGNGESSRAVTLATRDLASAGITDPTPTQLQAALMGGTVTNTQGQATTMEGVLQQRSQGMGWGNIAKANGVHPSQSEQGATNSQRFGKPGNDIAGADGRPERTRILSRESGQNVIARDNRAGPARSIGSTDRDHTDRRPASAQGKDRGNANNNIVASAGGRSSDHRTGVLRATDAASAQNLSRDPANTGPGTKDRGHTASKAKNGPGRASGPDRNASAHETGVGREKMGVASGNSRGLGGKGGK